MKGFLFSIDSMISIGLILIAATTLWVTINETNNLDLLSPKLQNNEVIALYFNEPARVLDQNNQKCEILYYYDSKVTRQTFTQTLSQKNICEGKQ